MPENRSTEEQAASQVTQTILYRVDLSCEFCRNIEERRLPMHQLSTRERERANRNAPISRNHVCSVCLPLYTCVRCGTVGTTHRTPTDELYCNRCFDRFYIRCGNCGTATTQQTSRNTYSHGRVCQACFGSEFFTCPECNRITHNQYRSNEICHECEESRTAIIKNHRYKPRPVFYGKSNNGLFYGVELEIELPDGENPKYTAIEINKAADRLYCKHDGSLNNGFEVVTHPHTFDEFMKEENWEFLKILQNSNATSHNNTTCGFHIHMSLDSFTALHLYKFMNFIYRNPDFVLFISQRKKAQLEQWARLYDGKSKRRIINEAKNKQNTGERYAACNITRSTIELRVFRGNLRLKRLLKNIQFCDSLYYFTKENTLKNSENIDLYRNYIVKHKKYIDLYNYLLHPTYKHRND